MAIEELIPHLIEEIEGIDDHILNFFKKLLGQKPEITPGAESVSLEPVRSEKVSVESLVEGQSDVADVETSDQESTISDASWEDAYRQELSEMSDEELKREFTYLKNSLLSLERDQADLTHDLVRGVIGEEEYETRLESLYADEIRFFAAKEMVKLELESRGFY